MSARPLTLVLGTAAGAFLAAGLIPLVTSPVAHAVCIDDMVGCDPDFIFATDPLLKMFGITDIGASDDGGKFDAMIVHFGSFTDVLTSGQDTSDLLSGLGVTIPAGTGIGEAGETVNTFIDASNPMLNSSWELPFTDPLAQLWDFLVANSFFGL